MPRTAQITRKTAETDIKLSLDLDGSGKAEVSSGVGFFDHMLTHLAKHGGFDIDVDARGDLEIDGHHTVEDVGICLGQAFLKAVGKPVGLRRFGHAVIPMDEALAEAAVDFSGRPYLVWNVAFPSSKIGSFDVELVREFFTAFAMNGALTLNVALIDGANSHHIAEACFKAVARALREAVERDPRAAGVPSTKGTLAP